MQCDEYVRVHDSKLIGGCFSVFLGVQTMSKRTLLIPTRSKIKHMKIETLD